MRKSHSVTATYSTARAMTSALLNRSTSEELATYLKSGTPVTAGQRLMARWITRELVDRQLYGEPVPDETVDLILGEDEPIEGDGWKGGN